MKFSVEFIYGTNKLKHNNYHLGNQMIVFLENEKNNLEKSDKINELKIFALKKYLFLKF